MEDLRRRRRRYLFQLLFLLRCRATFAIAVLLLLPSVSWSAGVLSVADGGASVSLFVTGCSVPRCQLDSTSFLLVFCRGSFMRSKKGHAPVCDAPCSIFPQLNQQTCNTASCARGLF